MPAKKHLKPGAKAKILIADTEGVFRLGLKKLFSVEDDLRVVAQAENCTQLVAMAASFRPDVAMVQQEIVLDGCHDLFGQFFRKSPTCKVLVIGSGLSASNRERLRRQGITGVIPRSERPEVFVETVRRIMRGQTIQNNVPETNKISNNDGDERPQSRPVDTLTGREKTVISCLTQGWRNRDIAEHLAITEQTVKNHLRSIYDKVGVSDRLELVLYAIHQRLELPPVHFHP